MHVFVTIESVGDIIAVLKVKDPATGTWVDITGTGVTGPAGGPVPVGGATGQTIVKQSGTDMDVAWEQHPRVAFESMTATVVGGAVNVLADLIVGTVTIDPDRWYHVFASIRCINDPGATAMAQFQAKCGVDLQGYDVVNTGADPNGLWGAWSQNWLHKGNLLNGNQPTKSVECKLRGMCSIASRTFYNPRLYIVEY